MGAPTGGSGGLPLGVIIMKAARRHRGLLVAPLALVLGAGLTLVAGPVQAQNDWVGDIYSYNAVTLVGGDYVWGAEIWQPAPVPQSVYYDANGDPQQVPPEWNDGAQPLAIEFDWGDGKVTQFTSDDPGDVGWLWCDNSAWTEDGINYFPNEDFGYNCRVEAGHTYTSQGIRYQRVLVSQGDAAAWSPIREQLVTDLSAGGTLTAKGTVQARSAGMFDQNYPQPGDDTTATFQVTAKRKAGTTATTALIEVSVPGMHPDYYQSTGMTFTGKAAMEPMYVNKTKTGGEIILSRVEGRVTTTKADGTKIDAGGAWAQIHVLVKKGAPTLVRITIWNTSAGYTYLDTGDQQETFYGLDSTFDRLLTGTVKIG